MNTLVAKKYTKAIMDEFKGDELIKFIDSFKELSLAFELEKFQDIIKSPTISPKEKEEFLLTLFKEKDERFSNLIKILSYNKRLYLIPEIYSNLKSKLVEMKNEYLGVVYSKYKISDSDLKSLEEKFSKKFNSKINLEYQKSDIDGIKIDIENLGVEISFSLDKLKTKISEYILQAI